VHLYEQEGVAGLKRTFEACSLSPFWDPRGKGRLLLGSRSLRLSSRLYYAVDYHRASISEVKFLSSPGGCPLEIRSGRAPPLLSDSINSGSADCFFEHISPGGSGGGLLIYLRGAVCSMDATGRMPAPRPNRRPRA
jgi:hypothetical protein